MTCPGHGGKGYCALAGCLTPALKKRVATAHSTPRSKINLWNRLRKRKTLNREREPNGMPAKREETLELYWARTTVAQLKPFYTWCYFYAQSLHGQLDRYVQGMSAVLGAAAAGSIGDAGRLLAGDAALPAEAFVNTNDGSVGCGGAALDANLELAITPNAAPLNVGFGDDAALPAADFVNTKDGFVGCGDTALVLLDSNRALAITPKAAPFKEGFGGCELAVTALSLIRFASFPKAPNPPTPSAAASSFDCIMFAI